MDSPRPSVPAQPGLLDSKRLGASLRAARKAAAISQAKLASRIGRDPKTIARWEAGTWTPSVDDLQKIAVACCTTIHALIEPVAA